MKFLKKKHKKLENLFYLNIDYVKIIYIVFDIGDVLQSDVVFFKNLNNMH